MRAQTLSVRERYFVEAARSIGVSDLNIIIRHVFPNVLTPVLVQATMDIGSAILIGAAISFIGLGVKPPASRFDRIDYRLPEEEVSFGAPVPNLYSNLHRVTHPGQGHAKGDIRVAHVLVVEGDQLLDLLRRRIAEGAAPPVAARTDLTDLGSLGSDARGEVEAVGHDRVRLGYRNSDGGVAEFCANGTRCAARAAVEMLGCPTQLVVETGWAEIPAAVYGARVTLDLPPPAAAPITKTTPSAASTARILNTRLFIATSSCLMGLASSWCETP